MNQLIAEGLILGVEGPDKRVGVALNPEKIGDTQPSVQNVVTFNLAPGAKFTGPVAVGQTISQTYEAASRARTDELRFHLEQLVLDVGKLVEATESAAKQHEISEDLSTFVQQANKETPSHKLLKITGEGLIEAAKTVASIAEPVSVAVKLAWTLYNPSSYGRTRKKGQSA